MKPDKLLNLRQVAEYLGIPVCRDEEGNIRVKRSVLRNFLDKVEKAQITAAAEGETKEDLMRDAFELDEMNRDPSGRRKDRKRRPRVDL